MTTYLITGGAGSLGKILTEQLSANQENTVRVFDINEAEMANMGKPNVRLMYGSITDKHRLNFAMKGVDVCIHTAAMKNLEISEYNVDELVNVNIIGTRNVVAAAAENNVKKLILISTDKAVSPISAYGVSKLMAEKIFLWANKTQNPRYSILRSGNFCDSRGNVFEVWNRQFEAGIPLTVTNDKMVRFFIKTDRVAELVLELSDIMTGGEILIPEMKRYKMRDLLADFYPSAEIRDIGIRSGEKLIEELMSREERSKQIIHCRGYRIIKQDKGVVV